MKILVAVKRAPDYNIKVRPKSDGSGPDLANVKMAINPFCEIAVEEAVRLKERGGDVDVVAVSAGPAACQEQLRAALALGADSGILVEVEDGVELQPLAVAKLLNALVAQERPDLILMGKQSIDGDNNQTGQMLAGIAGLAQGTFASKLVIDGDGVQVTREVDGGLQTVSLRLPAVVTSDLRLNEPRYASLPNIIKAKKKPLRVVTPGELGVDIAPRLATVGVEPPAQRKAGIVVESAEALVDKLKQAQLV